MNILANMINEVLLKKHIHVSRYLIQQNKKTTFSFTL